MSQVQPDEDKVRALETIFGGHDLSSSVIRTVLSTNGNKFDESVDILLGMSNSPSDPISVEEETQDAVREKKHRDQLSALQSMFGGDLTTSVICTVLDVNKGEMMDTVDTLLNMTSNDLNPRQEQKQLKDMRSEAERLRQEQELKHFEDFQKLQAQLRQQEAEFRNKAVRDQEIAKAKADKEARDRAAVLQEQQRILAEYELEKANAAAAAKNIEEEKKKLLAARLEEDKKIAALRRAADEKKAKELFELQQQQARLIEDQRRAAELKAQKEAEAKAEAERLRVESERREAARKDAERKETERRQAEQERWERMEAERKAALEAERRLFEEECRLERARAEEAQKEAELQQKKRLEEEKMRLLEERVRISEEKKRIEAKKREEERLAEEQRAKLQLKYYEEQEALKRSWDNKFKALHDEEERLYQRRIREEEEFRQKLATEEKRLNAVLEQERVRIAEELRIKLEKEQMEEQRRREEAELKRMQEQQAEADRLELEKLALEQLQAIAEEEKRLKQAEAALIASTVIVPEAVAQGVKLTIEVDGNEVKGTWEHEGAPNAYDWVALFSVRQTNNRKYTHSQYTTTNKGSYSFKKVLPGHYEVRFFHAKSYEPVLKSETVLVGPSATISTQLNGDQLMVQYTIEPPTAYPRSTWVGVYEKSQRRNKLYLATVWGSEQNYVCHKAPRSAGEYEVRLFVYGSNYNETASASFTVEDHDFVRASAKEIEGGAPLAVKFQMFASGVEPSASDWIGIFEGDHPSTKYLASAYTAGSSSGEVVIPAPKAAGVYECRLFSHGLGKYNTYRKSEPFTVLPSETNATPSPQ